MKKGLSTDSDRFPSGQSVLASLQKVHDKSTLTWLEIAGKLGISEAYLHRVRKGSQQFSRKVIVKLMEIEAHLPATFGEIREHAEAVYGKGAPFPDPDTVIAEQQTRISSLEAELVQAKETIHNQSIALAGGGRAGAGLAAGVNDGAHKERRGA